jgi:hypothetical protein
MSWCTDYATKPPNRENVVRFRDQQQSYLQGVHTDSGAYSPSYSMSTRSDSPFAKAAWGEDKHATPPSAWSHFPVYLNGVHAGSFTLTTHM